MSKNQESKGRKQTRPFTDGEIPSHKLVSNGELPHSTKKVSLGPNTKR